MFIINRFPPGLLCAGLMLSLPVMGESIEPPWADAAVPATIYNAPLADYHRYVPQTPGDWREANDTVGRIGGWQAYATEVWKASQASDAEQPTEDEHPPQQHNH